MSFYLTVCDHSWVNTSMSPSESPYKLWHISDTLIVVAKQNTNQPDIKFHEYELPNVITFPFSSSLTSTW